MSTEAVPEREGPDRGRLPIPTMIGVALSFLLFVVIALLMLGMNAWFNAPRDESAARKQKKDELQQSEQQWLNSYGKTGDSYHIPIEEAKKQYIAEHQEP